MRLTILISAFVFSLASVVQAQTTQFNLLCGKTWQVDQFYVDSVRVDDTNISSLHFVFQTNNQFRISGVDPAGSHSSEQGNWTWTSDKGKRKLTLTSSDGTSSSVFEITHLDQNVLAFVIRSVNSATGNPIIFEMRLRPV